MVTLGWSDFMGKVTSRVRCTDQLPITRGKRISEATSRSCCRRVLGLQGETSRPIPPFDHCTLGVRRWPGRGFEVSKLYVSFREV